VPRNTSFDKITPLTVHLERDEDTGDISGRWQLRIESTTDAEIPPVTRDFTLTFTAQEQNQIRTFFTGKLNAIKTQLGI
jgi:hypothetical protein